MQNEPPAELVEIAANVLAPFMEGGREFDQMPPDRIALRKWCREGMCSTNDATQDDALEAAATVLAAVTPQIEARVTGEIVACVMDVLGAVRDYLPPDGIPKDDFIRRVVGAVDNPVINPIIATIEQRGDCKESQP